MLEVNGVGFGNEAMGVMAPPKRKKEKNIFDDVVQQIKLERALIERKEIEAIKKKPKEERTFAEKIKLASYEIDRAVAFINKLPDPVVYVA